ncbi:AI-2E family transporter [Geodermatophilus sp. SYSU D00691]
MTDPEVRRALPLWLTVVLGVAGAAVAVWGIRAGAPVLAPVLLAFVLTVVAQPLVGVLVRRGVRRGLAVAAVVLVVDGGLIAFSIAVVVSVGQLATVLPQYADEWDKMLDGLRSALSSAGIGRDQVEQALSSIQLSSVVDVVGGFLGTVVGWLGAFVLVLATALFMSVEGAGLPERLARVPGTSRLRAALGEFARNTRSYLVVTTVFGFAVAVVDTIALLVLGIPLALLWGLLSFLTNYVPNIGFFLGLAPPTLLALLVDGPGTALLVVLIYSLANFVLQSVVQPVVVGDTVGLSVTLTFLSVIVWTLVLGPMGAVLAVPLTLFVHAVLVVQDPERRWAAVLLAGVSGGRPPRTRRTHRPRTAEALAEPPTGAPAESGERTPARE